MLLLLLAGGWLAWNSRAPYSTPLQKKKMAWDFYRAAGGAPAPALTADEEKELARQQAAETFSGSTLEPHKLDGSGEGDGHYVYESGGAFMREDGMKIYFSPDRVKFVNVAGNEKIVPRRKLTWTPV